MSNRDSPAGPATRSSGRLPCSCESRSPGLRNEALATLDSRFRGRTKLRKARPRSQIAIDEVEFEIAGIILGDGPAAHRLAGGVHRLAVAADEIVPGGQLLPGGAQAIGAGRGQPVDRADIVATQPHALGDIGMAMAIVRAQ